MYKNNQIKKYIFLFGLVYFLFSGLIVPLALTHMKVHKQKADHAGQHQKPVCAWFCSGYMAAFYDDPVVLNPFTPSFEISPIEVPGLIKNAYHVDLRVRPPPIFFS
ncbi:MAG TPA: hypothetical protein VGB26_14565 [Nitrospiria bacterium]|jgi:hypothetical protein